MKINQQARKRLRLRIQAGLLAILMLVSAEFWMVTRIGLGCGQVSAPASLGAPSLGDCLAVR